MGKEEENDVETGPTGFPEGFLCASFNEVLCIVLLTIGFCSAVASSGPAYILYVLTPFVIILGIVAVVSRRRVRKFLRQYGNVRVTLMFSPDTGRPTKSILSRDVGELLDQAVDRILDGKDKDNP